MNRNTLSGHSSNTGRWGHFLTLVLLTIGVSLFSFAGTAYPAPEIAIDSVSVNEADGSAIFTVTLSEPGDTGPITVEYTTTDSTALGGQDFNAASGTLNWPVGDNTPKPVVISIIDDATVENTETFLVRLSNPTGSSSGVGASITVSDGVGTISNNDAYSVAIADASATEGAAVSFTITLSAARSMPADVMATVSDGSATVADGDYANVSGPITIPAGAAGQTYTFNVPTTVDAKVEPNETFTVTLTSTDPNASMPAGPGTGTITNDDAYSVAIADASAAEGAAVSFTITLSAARSMPVTLSYATSDGTATVSDSDYTSTSSSITVPAGAAAQTFTFSVPTTADGKVEPNEAFTVTLTLTKPTATPATLTVARNTSAVSTAVSGFVDAYNALASQLKSRSAYGS